MPGSLYLLLPGSVYGDEAGPLYRLPHGATGLPQDGSLHDLHDGTAMLHEARSLHLLPDGRAMLHAAGTLHDLHDGRAMLYETRPVHDLHDGSADLHSPGSLLRAAHRQLPDVPLSDEVRAAAGSMLHDALRATVRLPPGSSSSLLPLPDDVRPGAADLQCAGRRGGADVRRPGENGRRCKYTGCCHAQVIG